MILFGLGNRQVAQTASVSGTSLVATDASTTPSTTRVTLGTGKNAVRVWFGAQTNSESYFYLYSQKNSDTVQKIKVYRWGHVIINGSAGDTFKFGTSDGRNITVAQMTTPAALITSLPTSGTANCDKAGPPLWSPSGAHVTLPSENQAIKITATGTDLPVFISEFDPQSGLWTPQRFIMLHRSRATSIQCTYRHVSIANYAGTALTINGPTGTVIGGTKNTMHLPFTTVTGTTRNVNSVATLKTAIAAAVAGDEIVIAAGTYAMDVAITHSSFTANNGVGGRVGAEGIIIRGDTGTATDVILTGNGTGTNGRWAINGGATLYTMFKDLSFDFNSLAGLYFSMGTGGKFLLENVKWSGATSDVQDMVMFANNGSAVTLDMLWCDASTGAGDLLNGQGDSNFNATSRVRIIGTNTTAPANLASAQGITTHTGLPVEIYGGTHKSANTNVIAPDSVTSPMYAYFCRMEKGTGLCRHDNVYTFGCYTEAYTFTSGPINLFNQYYPGMTVSTEALFRGLTGTEVVESGYVKAPSDNFGRAFFNSNASGNVILFGMIIDDFNEAWRLSNTAGAGGTATLKSSTIVNGNIALNMVDDNILYVLKNNATKGNTSGTANLTATGMSHTTTSYNVIDPAADADFVAGTNDVINADAGLDSDYFPTASGNCDGTGDSADVDWIGGRDAWGFLYKYKSSRASKGAREIPALHSGAILFADTY